VLHQSEGAKPKDCDTRAGKGTPVSVKVHLDVLVEDTVATFDCFTFDALSEIAGSLGQILNLVTGSSAVTFEEPQVVFA